MHSNKTMHFGGAKSANYLPFWGKNNANNNIINDGDDTTGDHSSRVRLAKNLPAKNQTLQARRLTLTADVGFCLASASSLLANNSDRKPNYWLNVRNLPVDLEETCSNFSKNSSKRLELELNDLILESCQLAREEKFQLAFQKAKESLELFQRLKQKSLELSKQENNRTPIKMTTGTNLFELSIMVYANLADQLKNNQQFKEAIEQYSKLMQRNNSASLRAKGFDDFNDEEQQESGLNNFDRVLLQRFGLNLGNIYHLVGDFRKALKFYRLTLDRLSSLITSEQRSGENGANCKMPGCLDQLKLKIMHNISLTLLLNYLQVNAADESGDETRLMAFNETRSAFQLLLADNLRESRFSRQANKLFNSNETQTIENNSMFKLRAANGENSRSCSAPINSNHNKLALNFITCLSQWGDRNLVMEAMEKYLPDWDICRHQQYLQVFDLSALRRSFAETFPDSIGRRAIESWQTGRAFNWEAETSGQTYANVLVVRQIKSVEPNLSGNSSASLKVLYNFKFNENRALVGEKLSSLKTDDSNQLSSSQHELWALLSNRLPLDEFESLIGERKLNIHKSTLISCNQLLELESLQTNCSRISSKALEFCLNLFKQNQGLISHLKVNCGLVELRKRNNLTNALVDFLKGAVESAQQAVDNENGYENFDYNQMLIGSLLNFNIKPFHDNSSTKQSIEKLTISQRVNLANCYFFMNQPDKAKEIYETYLQSCERDLSLLTNYNLTIINRKLSINNDKKILNFLSKSTNIFCLVQRALALSVSNESQDVSELLDDIFKKIKNDPHQSPEIYLIFHKIALKSNRTSTASSEALTFMQKAARQNLHYIPILECLIAAEINNNFNYNDAKTLIIHCITNRPDQVKWYEMLAETYRRSAEYQKALEIYKSTVEMFPDNCKKCLLALIKLMDDLGSETVTEDREVYVSKLRKFLPEESQKQ